MITYNREWLVWEFKSSVITRIAAGLAISMTLSIRSTILTLSAARSAMSAHILTHKTPRQRVRTMNEIHRQVGDLTEFTPGNAIARAQLDAKIEALQKEVKQLRGNLSLAEEGLANYQQEVERLNKKCAALATLAYGPAPPSRGIPQDGGRGSEPQSAEQNLNTPK